MKLHKRNCDIRIRLTPCGADFQKVQWSIGGDRHVLWPSSVMGGQFSDFLDAVYNLFDEPGFRHDRGVRRCGYVRHIEPNKGRHPEPCRRTITAVKWDEEGRPVEIRFTRRYDDEADGLDDVEIVLETWNGTFLYHVSGRELCYAVAKACTETLKKYGFFGYSYCSDDKQYCAERIDINCLLFVKAYALGASEVRTITRQWEDPNGWMAADTSPFAKEMELLLFDM